MLHLNPSPAERAREAALRQETRCLKYWLLKVRAAGLILALTSSLMISTARADESTGMSEDPKDMTTTTTTTTTTEVMTLSSPFLPLPGWSTFAKMPPLPDQLKPLGKKAVVVTDTTPVVPRDKPNAPPTPAVYIPRSKNVPIVNPNTTLIAVSPFLQWIRDHPTEATEQARKAASAYNPSPVAPPAPAQAPGASSAPYWMPPLIDSSDTTPPPSSSSTTTTGSSAAIYSTPQKN